MDKRREEKPRDQAESGRDLRKKEYKPPQVVQLGDLKEVTQSPVSGCGCGCGS